MVSSCETQPSTPCAPNDCKPPRAANRSRSRTDQAAIRRPGIPTRVEKMALTATKTEAVASSLSNFIDGRFVATGKSTFENRDPVTGELVNLVAEADATMVDDALKATTMGPPISQEHCKKVLSFYDKAEGAHRVAAQIEVGITWVNAWFLLRSPHAVRRLETVRHRPRRRCSFDGTLHRTAQRLRQTLKMISAERKCTSCRPKKNARGLRTSCWKPGRHRTAASI